ncbi:MAG TPA: hypothetical protein VGC56_01680 [Allosphingosinicella sp.]|jgi:hypothetical protein
MNRNKDMLRTSDSLESRVAPRLWTAPSVIRLSAGAAEVGTRSTVDGPLSSLS